jgi:hypothetical protein
MDRATIDVDKVQQAKKISRHRISLMYDGMLRSFPWTFNTSTTDGRWQVEEAGTDDQLTDNTDLEGDGFSTLADYPTPGSGDLTSVADAIGTVTFQAGFETNEPGFGKTNSQVAGYGTGLRRQKYDGNFSTSGNMSSYSNWDFTFFSGQIVPPLGEIFDSTINFGDQEDLPIPGGNHFSLQWVGYIKAPAAGDYNFYASSDDQVGLWIGSGALDIAGGTGTSGTQFILGNAGLELGPGAAIIGGENWGNYTVTMAADTWYPIVIWFGEFGGNCTCEIFAIESAGAKLAMGDFAFKYNPGSLGL